METRQIDEIVVTLLLFSLIPVAWGFALRHMGERQKTLKWFPVKIERWGYFCVFLILLYYWLPGIINRTPSGGAYDVEREYDDLTSDYEPGMM